MANSREYWQKRMQVLEDEQYQHSRQYYDDMQKQFRRAAANIRRDIDLWYERLAENNDVSYAEAKKLLKAGELEEFKWSVEDYIKAGRENAIDERWMKELENASARFHISYLEAMKLQIQQHAEVLSAQFEKGMGEYLQEEYAGQFYRTAFEISKGTGVGFNLARLDERRIDMLIKKPWAQDGKIFSDRIWSNKEKLITNLHTELTQCIIRGEPPRLAAERLAKKMNVSKAQAGTLIMTESAAIASASQRECFKELGMEQYEFDATLDGSTCKTCQGMDTKVFQMAQFEVGVTAPPVHPRCRCCVLPHFDDWEEFGISVERAARNPGTDETVYVDGKLSYPEWRARLNGDTRKENADDEKQKVYAAKRAEWKKKHGGDAAEKSDHIETQFDRNGLKEEIQEIRNEKAKLKAKSDELVHEEKVLTQKVYFDLNGTKEEKDRLKQLSEEKKAVSEQIKNAEERIFAKQKTYQEGVSGELVRSGVIEEIKLSKRMTPETVDELERTLIHLKNKYGIMPKGVIFAPMEVTDATVTYNWIDDTIYLSNKFNDLEEYKTVVHKAEDSLREYRAHYKIKERAEERLKWADDTLADKSIKGYDRANAAIVKAEAEIDLNITRAAVREKLSDTLIHEYGHFIHRHAELDYVQKKNVFGMKELGGKMMGGDWKYEINTGYCRAGKIEASKISKYATENPYETFAEGFLAMEKGEKIPESIERVITEATYKAMGMGADSGREIANLFEKGKKSTIMKIKFPDDITSIKGVDDNVKKKMDNAIKELEKEYEIHLDSIELEEAGKGDIFIVGWHDGKMAMVVNRKADFEKILDQIPKRYEDGFFAGRTLEDYIAHEMFHVMMYQDCKNEFEYRAKFSQIESLYENLKGISKYTDKSKSGNEALAEAFVRMRNGENVPTIAKVLVESYVGRWKR